MKSHSQLSKSVADHIISQNQKFKAEIIYLKRDLKKLQDKMIQCLDMLAEKLSSHTKNYNQLHLFTNPLQCLTIFVNQVTKSVQFSVQTFLQNKVLSKQNTQLQNEMQTIKSESIERIRKQEEIIENLNKQIEQKKSKLVQLQQNYQQLLKTKRVAQKQLHQTKQNMKILRLKLYEEQRQKLTQIIVANKKEMIEFRKSMQMESYKQQLEFKKQVSQKQKQIKLLTQNVEDLINNNLSATSDLTVLQKIVKPLRQSTQLKDQIFKIKHQLSVFKQQNRQKHLAVLNLEGKLADVTLTRDNLKSHNQRIQIQRNMLIINYKEKTQQLQKSQKDKKAMELYYSEKWHSQFSKVKDSLENKYTNRAKILQLDYEKKKKQSQVEVQIARQRLKIAKAELKTAQQKNQQLALLNLNLGEINQKLIQEQQQLKRTLKQSQKFHYQQLIQRLHRWNEQRQNYQFKINELQNTKRLFSIEFQKIKSQFDLQKRTLFRQKYLEIQAIQKQHSIQKQQIQSKYKNQIRQIQLKYSDSKQAIQAIRRAQILKYEEKQKIIFQKHYDKLRQIQKLSEMKIQKLNEKLVQADTKCQKLRKRREDQSKQFDQKLNQLNKILNSRQHQIISRDVEIQEFRKMKDTYMTEITKLHEQINEENFRNQSLQVQIDSINNIIITKQSQVKALQSQKYKFKEDLLVFQKTYNKQFDELDRINKKLVSQYKSKIWELESLLQKRPIKKKDFQHIQSLQKQNFQLKTQMHLRQAQNLVLNEVKQYYQQKAIQGNYKLEQNQENEDKLHGLTKGLLVPNVSHQYMKQTIKYNKPLLLKKPSSRKNKLLSNSFQKVQKQDQENSISQPKQIKQMKSYLMRQNRIQQTSLLMRNRTVNQRVKSSMM